MDNRITSWHINYSYTGLNQQEHGKLIPDHLCDICKDIDLSNYFETQKISFIHQMKYANSTLDYSVIEQKIPFFCLQLVSRTFVHASMQKPNRAKNKNNEQHPMKQQWQNN